MSRFESLVAVSCKIHHQGRRICLLPGLDPETIAWIQQWLDLPPEVDVRFATKGFWEDVIIRHGLYDDEGLKTLFGMLFSIEDRQNRSNRSYSDLLFSGIEFLSSTCWRDCFMVDTTEGDIYKALCAMSLRRYNRLFDMLMQYVLPAVRPDLMHALLSNSYARKDTFTCLNLQRWFMCMDLSRLSPTHHPICALVASPSSHCNTMLVSSAMAVPYDGDVISCAMSMASDLNHAAFLRSIAC